MYSARDTACAVGCPIRKSPDQSLLTAPRSLSQCATSFIASMRQGIHQMPLGHLRTPPCPEIRPDNPVKPQNTAVSDIKDQQKAKSLPSISDVKKPIHNVKEQSSFQPERQTRSIDDHPQPRLRRQNGGANRGQRGNPDDRRNQPDWWSQSGSNRRPQACKASALPTELWPLVDTCSQNTPAPTRSKKCAWAFTAANNPAKHHTGSPCERSEYGGPGWTRTTDLTLIRRAL
jgi:hypothetical protein